jgi:hypothetical protein
MKHEEMRNAYIILLKTSREKLLLSFGIRWEDNITIDFK